MPVTVHEISFRGLAGTIFILLTTSLVLYVIGFATPAWYVSGSTHEGLWETCECGTRRLPDSAWFNAARAMITIGLIGLCLSFILISVYMCIQVISKSKTLTALVVVSFVSVLFMLIGFVIYGVKKESNLAWSFGFTVAAGILTLASAVLSTVQMRKSIVSA